MLDLWVGKGCADMAQDDRQARQVVGRLSPVIRGEDLGRLWMFVLCCFVLGCGNPAQFKLNVSCADAQALQQVTKIVVWVTGARDGLCEQFDSGQLDLSSVEVMSKLTIERSQQNSGTIPQLSAGDLVFMAEGYFQDKVTLRGCSLVRFVQARSHVVSLELFVRCGADSDCDDRDRCTQNACVRGRCQLAAIIADPGCSGPLQPCTDPAFCPVVSVDPCQGAAGDCRHLDSACQVGACDPRTGQCAAQPRPDGTACNDSLYCTRNDSCQAGQCQGTARDCSAVGDPCSTGVCNESAKACKKVLKADPNAGYALTSGLTRYACTSYPGIGSCDSLTSTSITFTNLSPVSMNIYWLDYTGSLALYGTLSPGQSMGMGTFYTHPWLIRDACGNCMTLYVKGTPCWY